MAVINWPAGWQDEAVAVVSPLLGSDARVRITVGDPRTSISGSVLEGYLFLAPDGDPGRHEQLSLASGQARGRKLFCPPPRGSRAPI